MSVQLTWQDLQTGERKRVEATLPATLGRDPSNRIVLPYDGVSREHARLENINGTVVLTDLNSSNGVFSNGKRVQTVALTSGQNDVRLGPVTLQITIVAQKTESRTTPQAITPQMWNQAKRFVVEYIDPRTGALKRARSPLPITIGRSPGMRVNIDDSHISRHHAEIQRGDRGQLVVVDQNTERGTFINGQRCPANRGMTLPIGATIRVGQYEITIYPEMAVPAGKSADTFPPADLFSREMVDVAALQRLGMPIEEVDYLTIGGGLGSFIWADHLAIFGAKPHQIRSIGFGTSNPYERYQELCQKSQIPNHERLRSNSDSCPDNIWGWPGYAVREAVHSIRDGDFSNASRVLWQIFGEPTLVETYTPKSGNVFDSIDREVERIGWGEMWREGRVRKIRKTSDGRYVAAYVAKDGEPRHRFSIGRYLHLAVGYPAFRLVKDLQQYRERTGDFRSVVNAYENHEHVYEQLRRNGGGVVVVRGRGIVSSRIVQTLYELRQKHHVDVKLINMGRSLLEQGTGFYRGVRRPIKNNWEFQPFNWPKANWGGDLRVVLEKSQGKAREELLDQWGGTTTADRTDWQHMVRDGLAEGWYKIAAATVTSITKVNTGRLMIKLDQSKQSVVLSGPNGGSQRPISQVEADFIIDGTGLISSVDRHTLLKDLLTHYDLPRNVKGGLEVKNNFEMTGLRNNAGRVFACGVSTLGGPYAPVDSFLGLQYACLQSVDALVQLGAPNLRRLNFLSSFNQWVRWARGMKP